MGAACEHFLYDKGYGPTNLTLKQYLGGSSRRRSELTPVDAGEEFPIIEPTLLPDHRRPRTETRARSARPHARPRAATSYTRGGVAPAARDGGAEATAPAARIKTRIRPR